MSGLGLVVASAAAFAGTHLVLSHPLRRPLVRAAGQGGFLGIYSAVAFATLGALVWSYLAADTTPPLWPVGDGIWTLVTVLMLAASVLLMGSVVRNPASPGGGAPIPEQARGVFAITRHPMLWSFALWGVCHVLVYPVAKNIAVATSVIVLSLAGAALQDRKKAGLDPAGWGAWMAAPATGRSPPSRPAGRVCRRSACTRWRAAPWSGSRPPGRTSRWPGGAPGCGAGSASSDADVGAGGAPDGGHQTGADRSVARRGTTPLGSGS